MKKNNFIVIFLICALFSLVLSVLSFSSTNKMIGEKLYHIDINENSKLQALRDFSLENDMNLYLYKNDEEQVLVYLNNEKLFREQFNGMNKELNLLLANNELIWSAPFAGNEQKIIISNGMIEHLTETDDVYIQSLDSMSSLSNKINNYFDETLAIQPIVQPKSVNVQYVFYALIILTSLVSYLYLLKSSRTLSVEMLLGASRVRIVSSHVLLGILAISLCQLAVFIVLNLMLHSLQAQTVYRQFTYYNLLLSATTLLFINTYTLYVLQQPLNLLLKNCRVFSKITFGLALIKSLIIVLILSQLVYSYNQIVQLSDVSRGSEQSSYEQNLYSIKANKDIFEDEEVLSQLLSDIKIVYKKLVENGGVVVKKANGYCSLSEQVLSIKLKEETCDLVFVSPNYFDLQPVYSKDKQINQDEFDENQLTILLPQKILSNYDNIGERLVEHFDLDKDIPIKIIELESSQSYYSPSPNLYNFNKSFLLDKNTIFVLLNEVAINSNLAVPLNEDEWFIQSKVDQSEELDNMSRGTLFNEFFEIDENVFIEKKRVLEEVNSQVMISSLTSIALIVLIAIIDLLVSLLYVQEMKRENSVRKLLGHSLFSRHAYFLIYMLSFLLFSFVLANTVFIGLLQGVPKSNVIIVYAIVSSLDLVFILVNIMRLETKQFSILLKGGAL